MKKLIRVLLTFMVIVNSGSLLNANAVTKDELNTALNELDSTTITVWLVHGLDGANGEYYQRKASEFMELHPNITVELAGGFGYDGIQEKLLTSNIAGNMPTISHIEEAHIARLHPIAEDLNNYMSEEAIENYVDGLLNSSYIDGKLVAVPSGRSMPVLYYNKDLLQESGLETAPTTWEELEEYSRIITESNENTHGFGVLWDVDAWMWESAVYSWGGSITDEAGETITFNEDGIGEINIQMYQDMILEGTAIHPFGLGATAGNQVTTEFIEGNLGMYITSSAGYGSLATNEDIPFEVGIAVQPAGTENSVTTGGNNFIMTNTGTEEQKIAGAAFLEYLATDENSFEYFVLSGYMPTTESSLEYQPLLDKVQEDPNYQVIIDTLEYAHARPQTGAWREIYNYITPKLEEAMMKPEEIDVSDMMSEIVEQSQTILDSYNIGLN